MLYKKLLFLFTSTEMKTEQFTQMLNTFHLFLFCRMLTLKSVSNFSLGCLALPTSPNI